MRREFPSKVKLAAYERCQQDGKPHCEECGLRIVGLPEYDHVKPDGLGGEPTLANCQCICTNCHSTKSHTADRPLMQKADNIRAKHLGTGKVKRPWSKWRKKMSGEVVPR